MTKEILNPDVDFVRSLSRLPFLNNFDEKQLKMVLDNANIAVYSPGDHIIREGESDKIVYFLVSGQIRIEKDCVKVNDIHKPGEIFGEMCLFDDDTRSASVIAEKETTCLCLKCELFNSDDEEKKSIYQNILSHFIPEVLADRLRKMNNEISYLRGELDKARRYGRNS